MEKSSDIAFEDFALKIILKFKKKPSEVKKSQCQGQRLFQVIFFDVCTAKTHLQ